MLIESYWSLVFICDHEESKFWKCEAETWEFLSHGSLMSAVKGN